MINYNELVKEYPFLKTKEGNSEYLDPETDTWLTPIPIGWHGLVVNLCRELKEVLIANDLLDDYVVLQTKEKYGCLRWYDNQAVTQDLIRKYEKISEHTCIRCGKPSTHFSKGWYVPLCDECDEN